MRRLICLLAILVLTVTFCTSAEALQASTLRNGSRGEGVRKLQEALIKLGFLTGKADGIFGNKTENALRKFQKSRKLSVDGLAGPKTQAALEAAASAKNTPTPMPKTTPTPTPKTTPKPASSGNLFSGNYATIRLNDRGSRVKILQEALIRLKYLSGKADGIFGKKTQDAVMRFQKAKKLTADGLAGKKTLQALEAADKGKNSSPTPTPSPKASPTPAPSSPSSKKTAKAPDGSKIYLLHWFNDIKPSLKNGQNLLIYDPSTGISWTLRIYSRGRHCDAEPLTKKDTEQMVKAFGAQNTWTQKGVYVKLPSGTWTIGSTHDMPHMSGSIKDNGFDGHLCVHFLRDMSEAQKNDPSYGVANQETIRKLWKSLTGEEITN